MFKIEEIYNKDIWNKFLQKKEICFFPFFQSWNWGEVQKELGFDVLRLGVFDNNGKDVVGICQIVDVKAKRGHYLHLRHGPVFLEFSDMNFDFLIKYIKSLAIEKNASFIRVSPLIKKESLSSNFFRKKGFINAPIHNMDAEICRILDIDKPEDQILKEMRKTHRYLIKKAQNLNIKIIRSKKILDIDLFLNIYNKLSRQRHFVPHRGIKEEFEKLIKDDQIVLFLAEYEGNIIAGALIVFVGDMAIYHHGASDDKFRNIPASYLLQWEAILEARRRGKKLYNFWGIAPPNGKNHPWQGLTLFKTGFGGRVEEFVHAQDLPLNNWYWKNYFIEYVRKVLKGY